MIALLFSTRRLTLPRVFRHPPEIGDAAAFRANASLVEVVIRHRSADGLVLRSITMEILNNLTGLQVRAGDSLSRLLPPLASPCPALTCDAFFEPC